MGNGSSSLLQEEGEGKKGGKKGERGNWGNTGPLNTPEMNEGTLQVTPLVWGGSKKKGLNLVRGGPREG